MALDIHPDDSKIDPNVSCTRCEAVCCRLTVVLADGDQVADDLVAHDANGTRMMARGEDGWCVALDRVTRKCSIYETRPATCHRFVMGGGYCRLVRSTFAEARNAGTIPLLVA